MNRPSINPGRVEWSGERHVIFLKEPEDSDFAALVTLFRIVISPFGKGTAAFVLAAPDQEVGWPKGPNLVLSDNQSLARWLLDSWLGKMAPFAFRKGLKGAAWLDLHSAPWIPGDFKNGVQSETARAGLGVGIDLEGFGLSDSACGLSVKFGNRRARDALGID